MEEKYVGRKALITGASSGIGQASVKALHALQYTVLFCGRRTMPMKQLADSLNRDRPNSAFAYECDVRREAQVESLMQVIENEHQKIDVLINNAGLAVGLDPFQEANIEDWERMIDTNFKGLLYVSKHAIPLLLKGKHPQIIHLSSVAGKEVYPKGHVYCATKHAVDALARSMRIDLLPLGIRVSSIAPGMVETEFSLVRFKHDAEKAGLVYKHFHPLSAGDVADSVAYICQTPPHVNVADMVLMPACQAGARDIFRNQ